MGITDKDSGKQRYNPISGETADGRERCQALCRWLLDRWEELAIQPEDAKRQDRHNLLFGAKHSLMSALAELAELMVALDGDGKNEGLEAFPFGPVDLTVIEEFIRKARAL